MPSWVTVLLGGGILTWVWKGAARTTQIEVTQATQELAIIELREKVAAAHESHVTLALAVERLPRREEMISAIRDLRDDLRDDLRVVTHPQEFNSRGHPVG
jgi:hypothetical protein